MKNDNKQYACVNFEDCGNHIVYNGRGRKSKRCKPCQLDYSKRLRRDAYRHKIKDKVKLAPCQYKEDGKECKVSIPYVTRTPRYCPRHARKARLDWMRKYYTGEKVVNCEKCSRPIKYETKKPELCVICRARERIEAKRHQLGEVNNGNKVESQNPSVDRDS